MIKNKISIFMLIASAVLTPILQAGGGHSRSKESAKGRNEEALRRTLSTTQLVSSEVDPINKELSRFLAWLHDEPALEPVRLAVTRVFASDVQDVDPRILAGLVADLINFATFETKNLETYPPRDHASLWARAIVHATYSIVDGELGGGILTQEILNALRDLNSVQQLNSKDVSAVADAIVEELMRRESADAEFSSPNWFNLREYALFFLSGLDQSELQNLVLLLFPLVPWPLRASNDFLGALLAGIARHDLVKRGLNQGSVQGLNFFRETMLPWIEKYDETAGEDLKAVIRSSVNPPLWLYMCILLKFMSWEKGVAELRFEQAKALKALEIELRYFQRQAANKSLKKKDKKKVEQQAESKETEIEELANKHGSELAEALDWNAAHRGDLAEVLILAIQKRLEATKDVRDSRRGQVWGALRWTLLAIQRQRRVFSQTVWKLVKEIPLNLVPKSSAAQDGKAEEEETSPDTLIGDLSLDKLKELGVNLSTQKSLIVKGSKDQLEKVRGLIDLLRRQDRSVVDYLTHLIAMIKRVCELAEEPFPVIAFNFAHYILPGMEEGTSDARYFQVQALMTLLVELAPQLDLGHAEFEDRVMNTEEAVFDERGEQVEVEDLQDVHPHTSGMESGAVFDEGGEQVEEAEDLQDVHPHTGGMESEPSEGSATGTGGSQLPGGFNLPSRRDHNFGGGSM